MVDHLFLVKGADAPTEGRREVRQEWPAWLLLAALWLLSLRAMGHLPARVPMHWNLHNEIDGWGTPLQAALLLPGLATAIYLFALGMDWGGLDFKLSTRMAPATKRMVRIFVLALLGALQAVLMGAILRGSTPKSSLLFICVAVFLILVGNLLPRFEINAGIGGWRVPPTLEDPVVWKATHRFGGRVFVGAGVLLLPLSLMPERPAVFAFIAILLVSSILPVIYAYRLRAVRKS